MKDKNRDIDWKEILFCISVSFIMVSEAIGIPTLGMIYGGIIGLTVGTIFTIIILALTAIVFIKIDNKYLKYKQIIEELNTKDN